ncbi:MAG TPA: outer membrane beta-barrel protein [Tepidisphaeraceae bacterium]|jgi:hypothetical protein|nr:outer membrane beta-barrel protein [Tepidisphaeraceae bacterium]
MFQHRRIARAAIVMAAFATIAGSSSAFAAEGAGAGSSLSLSNEIAPHYLDENSPGVAPGAPVAAAPSLNAQRTPLMGLLEQAGVGRTLDDLRLNIYGHIEGSYTYNTDNPAEHLNLGRVFDINDLRGEMNQLDLNLERIADPHQFDLGGRLELLYGADARFIHGSDFIDYDNKNVANSTRLYNGPEYQFDIPQLYLDLTLPIGEGIRIRAGKFLFFKQIDPNASVFYSHSFTFGGALPFTLTGITAYYAFNDNISVEGGISRGWGQTFTDNNGAIDGLGRVNWKINSQSKFTLAFICGPELNDDNSHYRTAVDATFTYTLNPQTTLLFDGVYGYQAQPSGTTTDEWYGISGYVVYKLSSYTNINFRGEFYRDEGGLTTGLSQSLFEGTLGLTVTPFPDNAVGQNLKIRPEVRYDYSNVGYFNGLTEHSQWTLAVDAFFDF